MFCMHNTYSLSPLGTKNRDVSVTGLGGPEHPAATMPPPVQTPSPPGSEDAVRLCNQAAELWVNRKNLSTPSETKRASSGLIGKAFTLPAVFGGYLRSRRTGLSRCLHLLASLMAYSSFPLPDSFITGQQKNTGFIIWVFF